MLSWMNKRMLSYCPREFMRLKIAGEPFHSGKETFNLRVIFPRGQVFVFTGLLPVAHDEDGLAAVLGHEVAHAAAHHQAERMSSQVIVIGAVYLLSILGNISEQLTSSFVNLLYELPNSRVQEASSLFPIKP